MSASIIMAAVKVVGVVLAAKSMVEGIKEGDWLKAVVGGVSAYYGVKSFAVPGASDAANVATEKVASDAVSGGLLDAGIQAPQLTFDPITSAANSVDSFNNTLQSVTPTDMTANIGVNSMSLDNASRVAANTPPNVLDTPQHLVDKNGGGFFDKIGKIKDSTGNWIEENPSQAYAGMQLAGGMMQGRAAEKQAEQRRRDYEADRDRRGAAPTERVRARYNPQTRRMEMA